MAFVAPKEMISRLEESSKRFEMLTEQLSVPEVIANRESFQKLSRERSGLENIVTRYLEFRKNLQNYESSRKMMETEKDPDIREMAQMEVSELEPVLVKEVDELQLELLPKDPNDDKNIMLEVRAGVGGDEAGIFAGDLYRMYSKYAGKHKFNVELMSVAENSSGGFKEIIALISGDRVYSYLKYESGVHRVQRVPKTEAQGRVHTSTATVMVLPEAEEIDLVINPNDLRIDVFRSGGNGGQSVNTTDSAVRITYLPTNEVVVCQDEKSQLKNKAKAMKVLRTRLLQQMQDKQNREQADKRKSQVGGGFRNERIRTYNFPQGRITDHRIGMTVYDMDAVMGGEMDQFTNALTNYYQLIALKGEDAVQKPIGGEDD
jgi:peptide chain release factor 1